MATVSKSLKQRQSEPLNDEGDNELWAGSISIGTPGQTFLIDFDSKLSVSSSHIYGLTFLR